MLKDTSGCVGSGGGSKSLVPLKTTHAVVTTVNVMCIDSGLLEGSETTVVGGLLGGRLLLNRRRLGRRWSSNDNGSILRSWGWLLLLDEDSSGSRRLLSSNVNGVLHSHSGRAFGLSLGGSWSSSGNGDIFGLNHNVDVGGICLLVVHVEERLGNSQTREEREDWD